MTAGTRWAVKTHGYGGYGGGCRCDICRSAKAAYTQQRREEARQRSREFEAATGQRYVAEGITHGITGYQAHACRCFTCRLASSQHFARRDARRADRKAAGGGR